MVAAANPTGVCPLPADLPRSNASCAPDRRATAYTPRASLNDPEHWRDCAKEARAMAENMADPQGGTIHVFALK